MSLSENHIYASQLRSGMIQMSHARGNPAALNLARLYIHEIGEVVAMTHGRDQAASLLYEAADACAGRLPLAEIPWSNPQPPEQSPQPAASRTIRAAAKDALIRFFRRNSIALPLIIGLALFGLFNLVQAFTGGYRG